MSGVRTMRLILPIVCGLALCAAVFSEAVLAEEIADDVFIIADERDYDRRTRGLFKKVAECAVRANEARARAFVEAGDLDSIIGRLSEEDLEEFSEDLELRPCLSRAQRFGPIFSPLSLEGLRNLLAEEIYLADNDQPLSIEDNAPRTLHLRNFPSSYAAQTVAKSNLADCIVFEAPDEADALVRTDPGVRKEREAIEALFPALFACVQPQHTGVEVEVSTIRTLVADALWARSTLTSDAVPENLEEVQGDNNA